jgi:hypothetical protein
MKKTFCILEQGKTVNEVLTTKKKEMFTTEFSDFYRLNWFRTDDPNAFIAQKNIVWSEGRSLLYEKVPKNYDYYIFTDDDIEFYMNHNSNTIAKQIHLLLTEYQPITGTFLDKNLWHVNQRLDQSTHFPLSRKCFPIGGYDLQVQLFCKSFADLVFPVIYHGSDKSMWYSQWICYALFPLKQICFTEVQVNNLRHEDKINQKKLPQFTHGDRLLWLFNKDIKDKENIIRSQSDVFRINKKIFSLNPDKGYQYLTLKDLDKIYNVNNFYYKKRKSIGGAKDKKRDTFYYILWQLYLRRSQLMKKLRKLILRLQYRLLQL